jgi:hypothetical protein
LNFRFGFEGTLICIEKLIPLILFFIVPPEKDRCLAMLETKHRRKSSKNQWDQFIRADQCCIYSGKQALRKQVWSR